MNERAFTLGVALVMVAVVAFGFFVAGGPMGAREAAQDEERERRLRRVKHSLECVTPRTDIPPQLTLEALQDFCPARLVRRPVVDPETKAPFVFDSPGEQFEVCATFHNPKANDRFTELAPPRAEALKGDGVFCVSGMLRKKREPVRL